MLLSPQGTENLILAVVGGFALHLLYRLVRAAETISIVLRLQPTPSGVPSLPVKDAELRTFVEKAEGKQEYRARFTFPKSFFPVREERNESGY